jgi:hypothetical protein
MKLGLLLAINIIYILYSLAVEISIHRETTLTEKLLFGVMVFFILILS